MATRQELLIEANNRGLLTGQQKSSFDEAVRRGIITPPQAAPAQIPAQTQTVQPQAIPGEVTPQQLVQPKVQPQPIAAALTQQPPGVSIDIPTDIDSSVALPVDSVQPVEPTLGQEVVGGLGAAGQIISGAVAEPIAGLAGLITAPFVGVDEAVKNINAVRQFFTIETTTPEGQRNLRVVGDLVDKGVDLANVPTSGLVGISDILTGQGLEQAAKSVERVQQEGTASTLGNAVLKATDSPALAALAHSLPTLALELIGVKGLKSTRLASEKLSGNIAEAITQAAPDIQTIKRAKTQAYKDLDNLGIKVRSQVFDNFADNLQSRLSKEGLRIDSPSEQLFPKSSSALKTILDEKGATKTAGELETLRRVAKGAANSIDKPDARLGTIIVDEIDKGIDALANQVGGKFKEARSLAQRAFKSQAITDMIEDASHTASGMENGLRIEVRKLLKNKKKRKGFTKDELDSLRKIEQGTTSANIAKFLGKFGISEGQATSMLGASIGIGGGGAIGAAFGPGGAAVGALTVPALGQIAKKTAQRITLNNTKFADDLVRSGKNAREITKAYLKHTPIDQRRVSDLTDLFMEANIRTSDIRNLPASRPTSGKLIADSIFFANEIKRRAKQTGSAALIAQPQLEQEGQQ